MAGQGNDQKLTTTPPVEEKPMDISSVELADDKSSDTLDKDEAEYKNGEPIITTGRDVSRFAVDIRDDGDAALTFRSIVIGTVFAGLGAALAQAKPFCSFSPVHCANRLGVDLLVQASADVCLDGFSAFAHLFCRELLRKAPSEAQSSGRDQV
jgi:hypothetical protein